jgi:hypothetical protein
MMVPECFPNDVVKRGGDDDLHLSKFTNNMTLFFFWFTMQWYVTDHQRSTNIYNAGQRVKGNHRRRLLARCLASS